MTAAEDIDLSNKDWLTIEEAAFYCRVSRSHFLANAHKYQLEPRDFMGKKLYEKTALYEAIYGSRKWQRSHSTGAANQPISTGGMAVVVPDSPSVALALEKLRRYEKRRKQS